MLNSVKKIFKSFICGLDEQISKYKDYFVAIVYMIDMLIYSFWLPFGMFVYKANDMGHFFELVMERCIIPVYILGVIFLSFYISNNKDNNKELSLILLRFFCVFILGIVSVALFSVSINDVPIVKNIDLPDWLFKLILGMMIVFYSATFYLRIDGFCNALYKLKVDKQVDVLNGVASKLGAKDKVVEVKNEKIVLTKEAYQKENQEETMKLLMIGLSASEQKLVKTSYELTKQYWQGLDLQGKVDFIRKLREESENNNPKAVVSILLSIPDSELKNAQIFDEAQKAYREKREHLDSNTRKALDQKYQIQQQTVEAKEKAENRFTL